MQMTVKEVSKISNVSIRTLHHYDHIGLLKADHVSHSGYRYYSEDNLERLQQILFFKALDMPLKKIKSILDDDHFDAEDTLKLHKKLLLEKRTHIDQMIHTIDRTLLHYKGEIQMTQQEKFEGFNFQVNPYEQEAKEKWGEDTVNNANKHIKNMSKNDYQYMEQEMNDIFKAFANKRTASPGSTEVQQIVQRWYQFLNSNINYEYTLDVFQSLGEMYVTDERFTQNIDQFGPGTAKFIQKAINVYVKNNK